MMSWLRAIANHRLDQDNIRLKVYIKEEMEKLVNHSFM